MHDTVLLDIQMTPQQKRAENREDFDYDEGDYDDTCKYCHGDGGDPYCDYILPCPRCNGEGYEYWR